MRSPTINPPLWSCGRTERRVFLPHKGHVSFTLAGRLERGAGCARWKPCTTRTPRARTAGAPPGSGVRSGKKRRRLQGPLRERPHPAANWSRTFVRARTYNTPYREYKFRVLSGARHFGATNSAWHLESQSKKSSSPSGRYCLAASRIKSTPRPGLSQTSIKLSTTIGSGSPVTMSYHQSGRLTGYSKAM